MKKKKKTFMCFGSILLSFPSKLLKKKKKCLCTHTFKSKKLTYNKNKTFINSQLHYFQLNFICLANSYFDLFRLYNLFFLKTF